MLGRTWVLLLTLCLFVAALTFTPMGSDDPNPEMEIYLLSNEIHTDIVVPVKNEVFNWENFLNPQDFKQRPGEWMEIGWGDRQFYFEMPTWDKFTLKLALDALFIPDPAIIHVNYLESHPKNYPSHRRIKISNETYKKIVTEIKKRFLLQKGAPILIPGKGYSPTDNFYESVGSFSLLRTCNMWTSEVLGEVGLKRPVWSPTKYGLEYIYSK